MNRKFFSLVIPCHNPEKTIDRLYNSLTRQNISLDDLEVIVVDDNSDNLEYREIIKKYKDINSIFIETDTNIHCPGNTRQKGLEQVSGQWVFFADQDDYFEDNALCKVKKFIEAFDIPLYVISTIMRGYSDKFNKCYSEFPHKQAWLHGKWYSMDNLIIPYDIKFKKDLVTHEDIYFNSLVLSQLYLIEKDWTYLDAYTYRWVDNPESITRKPTEDRGYLFENFQDYLIAAGEPYWEAAKKSKNVFFVNQIMMTILHAYFYYEAMSFYYGSTNYQDILNMIKEYIRNTIEDLHFTPNYIIDYIYSDPEKFSLVQSDCDMYTGKFIPKTSFRDFILKLTSKN